MAIFAISDLHLSLSADKSMDIFTGWDNYVERLQTAWHKLVTDDDTVIIPGDISWAMKLKDTYNDFKFINELPGKKIILKGNHDLWWESITKMNKYIQDNGFNTISFLHNNFYEVENVAVCGSRGWFFDAETENKKILLREAGRIETSIKLAVESGKEPILFLHYPPITKDSVCEEIMSVIKKYGIKKVFYGHIHKGGCLKAASGEIDGIMFRLISCDMINFSPYRVSC